MLHCHYTRWKWILIVETANSMFRLLELRLSTEPATERREEPHIIFLLSTQFYKLFVLILSNNIYAQNTWFILLFLTFCADAYITANYRARRNSRLAKFQPYLINHLFSFSFLLLLDICVHIAASRCCTAESNTTL